MKIKLDKNMPVGAWSQSVTTSKRNVRHRPYAFTEHGAIMAASVLNTPRAIEVSVYLVRAFVKLREYIAAHGELERKVGSHDQAIRSLVAMIRQLMQPPVQPKRRPIGFHATKEGE